MLIVISMVCGVLRLNSGKEAMMKIHRFLCVRSEKGERIKNKGDL